MFLKRKKKILLVDDSYTIILVVTAILEDMGFEVSAAKDGEEALQKATKQHPDLILLDVILEGMDGLMVCKILKENPETKNIPIILLTGKAKTSDIDKGFRCGANDYLIKPVDKDRLEAKISKLLNIKIK